MGDPALAATPSGGESHTDMGTLLLLGTVALLANLIPVRRVTAVDPVAGLRNP